MNTKDMKQFAQEVLNNAEVREALRQRVEQIDRLESLEGLKDLKITGLKITDSSCKVNYQAIASENLYPHVRANLIKQGVINRGNVISSETRNTGQTDDCEYVRFGVSGNSIIVSLKAYNPNYKE